jgi:uncharacterized protein (TIGR02757 family)
VKSVANCGTAGELIHLSVLTRRTLNNSDLKALLDAKFRQYCVQEFIAPDPISIPYRFTRKEDIEIAGLFSATLAWGNRKAILASATRLMQLMDEAPHDFVVNHTRKDLRRFENFAHRTFNGDDAACFIKALAFIYKNHGGLEAAFGAGAHADLRSRIMQFRKLFFQLKHPARTGKHVSDPSKKSSAKRICMFLRWMVRENGVDFGFWKSIRPAELALPLDVHTGRVSRSFGLLKRKQNDWLAVEEVTARLREFDPEDPVKYDFALFGMGVNEKSG